MEGLSKINQENEIETKEKLIFELEQNPEIANTAYEALGFKSKDFIYTSEFIDEIIKNPDFEELLPVAQILKERSFIDKTKVFIRLVNETNNSFGETTSFIENNKISSNVSIFDKKYYEAIKNTLLSKDISQQETLLHEEIHRYTNFIIGEYNKLNKFPGIESYKEFNEHFNSFGIDVSKEVEFLKEYFNFFKIYRYQGGWLNSIEFITYGLTNKAGIKLLKSIEMHENDIPQRIKDSLTVNKHISLYDVLLDSFKHYYINLSDDTHASTTDTFKLKFDNVLVSSEQKNQAEQIYSKYLKTLTNKETITKEGFIDFINKNNQDS